MGWALKVGALFIALLAAAFGAWIITVPVLALLFVPPLLSRKGNAERGRKGPSKRDGGHSYLSVAGWLLVLLSAVAFLSGGTLSPLILLVGGLGLLFRRHLSITVSTSLTPVGGSILLRHKLAPYRWTALAEAKVSTRDLEGALSGVRERLCFVSDPSPRIFLVFTTTSLGKGGAERALTRRMRVSTRSLVPLGIYLLPLDSAEAAGLATIRSPRVEPISENLRQQVSTADYGALVLEAQQGFVTRFDVFAKADPGSKGSSVLSPLRTANKGQLTLRELIHEARIGLGAPHPDRYGAFLSSMAATEGEAPGQRITETAGAGQEQVVLVGSLGNPPVELTRAQLRAIARIYE